MTMSSSTCPAGRAFYFICGALVLVLAGVFIRRQKRLSAEARMRPATHTLSFQPNNFSEKKAVAVPLSPIQTSLENSIVISEAPSASISTSRIPGPRIPAAAPPPPFAPQQQPQPQPQPPLPPSPTFDPETNTWTFDSFAPAPKIGMPSPRRRSYTKNMPDGGEISGEIVVAEGWRRHTRVFGGGVCTACQESERKMSA